MFFDNPEDLMKAIDDYFDNPPMTTLNHKGEIFQVPRITMEDCAFSFGACGRQFWYDQHKRGPEWDKCAQYVREKEAAHYKIMGQHIPGTFPQFMLSNLGYSSKQEIDHTSSDGSMRPTTVQLVGPDGNGED